MEATLNALLVLVGTSLAAVAFLLVLNLNRVWQPWILRGWIRGLLIAAIGAQVIAMLLPRIYYNSYLWLTIAALPILLLPQMILREARVRPASTWDDKSEDSDETERKAIPSRSAQAEFNEQLNQIPRILAQHADGLTLVEIGEKMGVEWRRLTGAARELLERGRIQKEGKKYFISRARS